MSLSEACLRCLDFCWQHGFKAFFSFLIILASPNPSTVLTFCWQVLVQSPFFRQSWRHQNEISLPPHPTPPTPLAQVKLSKVRSWCVGPYLSIYLSILSIYLSILSVCQSVGRSVCLSVCRPVGFSDCRSFGLAVGQSACLSVCRSLVFLLSLVHSFIPIVVAHR